MKVHEFIEVQEQAKQLSEENAALKTERDKWKTGMKLLIEEIERAPHHNDCDAMHMLHFATPRACNCWKARALK